MKRLAMPAMLVIVALSMMTLPAHALVITTADGNGADTYVNGEGTGYHYGDTNFGASDTMECRRHTGGDYTRKGYVRFDIAGVHASDVTLKLTLSSTIDRTGADATMNVWGLNDGYPGVDNSSPANGSVNDDEDTHDERWPETVIDWFSAPGNAGNTTMDPASTTLLGSFVVAKDAAPNTTYTFNDPNLLSMVQNDANGVITLVMQPQSGDNYVYFYTKEGTGTLASRPQLVVPTAALTWDGEGGANKAWSHAPNWNPDGLPTDSATFNNTATAAAGTVTNIVDEDFTIGSLTYQSTANAHTTQIDAGVTLRLFGEGTGRSLVVGNVPSGGAHTTAVITGGGTLVVDSPTEDIFVSGGSTSSPNPIFTLDMSGLATFEATINEFRIGTENVRTQAEVTLANTNTITADTIFVGSCTYTGLPHFLRLGQTNTINSTTITVGQARSTGTLEFDPALSGTPTVEIRGKAGGSSRANMSLGYQYAGGSSRAVGTADFTAGSVDAMLGTVIVGRNAYGYGNPGGATGTLSFDEGDLDATTITLGRTDPIGTMSGFTNPDTGHTYGTLNMGGGTLIAGSMALGEVRGHGAPNNTDSSPSVRATGTLNLSGGSATVTGNVTLANHTSTGTALATGIINITGGSLTVHGNLVEGAGGANSVSTVNADNGTLTVDGDLKVDSLRVGIDGGTGSVSAGGDVVIGASGILDVGRGAIGTGNTTGILDLSGAASFTADLDEFRVSTGHVRVVGQVTLGATNTITTGATVVGSSTYTGTVGNFIRLGQANTLNTDKIIVGGARSSATLEFDPALSGTPTVTIRGKAGGTSRAAMWLGDQNSQGGYGTGGSSRAIGTAVFTGGSLDAMLSTLTVGRNGYVASNQPGGATGTFSFDAGTLDATTIYLGLSPLLANTNLSGFDLPDEGHAYGTLNMGGGTLLAGSMTLGRVEGSAATATSIKPRCTRATGTFNLSGGDATVTGDLVLGHHTSDGPLEATGIINVTGGSLAIGGNLVEGTGGATSVSTVTVDNAALTVGGDIAVDTLTFSSGTLQAASISGPGTFNWTGGTLHVETFGFDLVQNGGTLAPGESPGQTDVLGGYLLNAGILEIEINGTDRGDQSPLPPNDDDVGYDFVSVSGDAVLDSMLQLVLLAGYVPPFGTGFDVLTAQTITLGQGFGLDQSQAGLAGANEFKYSVVGGLNGEILRLQVVPEPATMALLGLGAVALVARRRKKR